MSLFPTLIAKVKYKYTRKSNQNKWGISFLAQVSWEDPLLRLGRRDGLIAGISRRLYIEKLLSTDSNRSVDGMSE